MHMKKILVLVLTILLPAIAISQVEQVKGVGTVTYSGRLDKEERQLAYSQAQIAAIERYFAESGEADSANFDDVRSSVEQDPDTYILSTTVLSEDNQSDLKKYSVSLRIELNVAKLRNAVRASSSVSQATNAEKSQIVYLFIGREAASVKSFDDRVVNQAEISVQAQTSSVESSSGKEGETITSDSISTETTQTNNQNVSENIAVIEEVSGSQTRTADQSTYRLLPTNNIRTSITSVFTQAGFAVAEPEFVIGSGVLEAVKNEFSQGEDLSPSTLINIVADLKKFQVPYLVVATLDAGIAGEDPASGLQRVAVTVTGRVLDLTGAIPREAASVPAVQYFGVGPDSTTASTSALREASLAAAKEVVSRMNVSGIK